MPRNDSTESESITTLTWEEAMIQKEKEWREAMHSRLLEFHARNRKDNTTPWLLFTKWGELLKDRDMKTIAETRYLNTENQEVVRLSPISKSRLCVGASLDSASSVSASTSCWSGVWRHSRPPIGTHVAGFAVLVHPNAVTSPSGSLCKRPHWCDTLDTGNISCIFAFALRCSKERFAIGFTVLSSPLVRESWPWSLKVDPLCAYDR